MGWRRIRLQVFAGWQTPGALAGASLVPEIPWRLLPDLGSWLTTLPGPAGVGFVALQSAAGNERLGLTLAWVLIGYLTYQYTPYLYPGGASDITERPGFKTLTALTTLYFGIVVGGGIADLAVPVHPLRVISADRVSLELVLIAVLTGIVAGSIAFWLYLRHVSRAEPTPSDRSAPFQSGYLSIVSFEQRLDQYDSLPKWWREFEARKERTVFVLLPVIPCVAMGFGGVLLNVFYPLPEAALFIGLIIVRFVPESVKKGKQIPTYELDLRLLDSVSGSTQNPKGTSMILFTICGGVLSGGAFVYGLVYFIPAVGASVQNVLRHPFNSFYVLELGAHALLLVAILEMGLYSLLHWLRQAERVEPYARYWETKWTDEDGAGDKLIRQPPSRLPWLLVPAHLPIIAVIAPNAVWSPVEPVLWEGWIALALVSILTMAWGLVRGLRQTPQPVFRESRDLLATFVLQFGLYMSVAGFVWWRKQLLSLSEVFWFAAVVAGFLTVFGLSYYQPDIQTWKSRQNGIRKFIGDIPLLTIGVVFVAVLRLMNRLWWGIDVGIWLQILVFVLILAVIVDTATDIYTESLKET